MTTTPTNPAAIYLDDTELEPSDVERGDWQAGTRDYVERLEVVVEALRENMKEDAAIYVQEVEHWTDRAEAAVARVVELEGELKHEQGKLWDSAGRNNALQKRAEAAEARVVELENELRRKK